MVNCAHPSHFDGVLSGGWTQRIRGLRAKLPNLNVPGGCCGTDHRHLAAVSAAWQQA